MSTNHIQTQLMTDDATNRLNIDEAKNDIEGSIENIYVSAPNIGMRLDAFLALHLPDISRTRLQSLIKNGHVSCSIAGAEITIITNKTHKTREGESYVINLPKPEPTEILPADIPIHIAFEDEHMLVIDKQAGLTVHPGAGNINHTLVNALLHHCGDTLSGIGGVTRPGIVHRLDKDTSGLMVVAKHDKAHNILSSQISSRELKRIYMAIIWGCPTPPFGKISANIGRSPRDRKKMTIMQGSGRHAITHYTVLERFLNNKISLTECRLETGRTHQIRVHMPHVGHPLLGDQTYGHSHWLQKISTLPQPVQIALESLTRQALHSTKITFMHPITEKILSFESNFSSPTCEDISKLITALRDTT